MSKHTPAPWDYKRKPQGQTKEGFCVGDHEVYADGDLIYAGTFQGVSDEEREANAHLIAAAPEMYDALKEMSGFAYGKLEDRSRSLEMRVFIQAQEAIAKAEGKL